MNRSALALSAAAALAGASLTALLPARAQPAASAAAASDTNRWSVDAEADAGASGTVTLYLTDRSTGRLFVCDAKGPLVTSGLNEPGLRRTCDLTSAGEPVLARAK